MSNPFKHDTGWATMDKILDTVAYGVAIIGALCLVLLLGWLFVAHWKVFG